MSDAQKSPTQVLCGLQLRANTRSAHHEYYHACPHALRQHGQHGWWCMARAVVHTSGAVVAAAFWWRQDGGGRDGSGNGGSDGGGGEGSEGGAGCP